MSRIEIPQPADHSKGKKDDMSLLGFYATALPLALSFILAQIRVTVPHELRLHDIKFRENRRRPKPPLYYSPSNAFIVPDGGTVSADIENIPYLFHDFPDTKEARVKRNGVLKRRASGTYHMSRGEEYDLDTQNRKIVLDNGVMIEYQP